MDSQVIGILGGGQLGRMMTEAANRLNLKVAILDTEKAPATQIHSSDLHVKGSFRDAQKILELAQTCRILTAEIEHVDTHALESVQSQVPGLVVHPSPATIRLIQDKYVQKLHFSRVEDVPIGPFRQVVAGSEVESILEAAEEYGYPVMLKSRTLAYDGKGNAVVRKREDIPDALESLKSSAGSQLYVEKWITFKKELAVMVAKSTSGELVSYPCVETVQKDNICHLVIAPAQIDGRLAIRARDIAERVVAALDGAGIFGVELFLTEDDEIYLNEIAPRPHNSGHYTIEACDTSQFEQHLRCILGLPLGSPNLKVPASIMINLIGTGSGEEALSETLKPCFKSLSVPGSTIHLYGKKECRAGRKMGHITVVGDTMPDVISRTESILGMPHEDSSSSLKTKEGWTESRPLVGIIMGSDSDLPTLRPAAIILKGFGVPFELTIVSAHRTPDRMFDYAKSAHERGIKVIIAAAGGAAHLPGMVAAITPLPVIGVPVALKVLDGVDSLHSIVQMPRGVPVATVAINNSTNAALLAVRILGSHFPSYLDKMMDYQRLQEEEVMKKVEVLESVGWADYGIQGK